MTPVIGPRRLESWIDSFERFTNGLPSPAIFRRWAGITALAGAMERRLWVKWHHGPLYPNMYVILVGPPGIGKSQALSRAEALWRSVPEFHVSPSSVSKASLMDALFEAKRVVVKPYHEPVIFNNLLVAASEFGTFLPSYDNEFMSALQKIYDGELYDEQKRTNKVKFSIPRPLLTLLAGTTPNYMMNMFPEGAWDQGFAARTIIIFSGERIYSDPFTENTYNEELLASLIHDLRLIADYYGKIDWTPAAAHAFTSWRKAGENPLPDHPKLANYITRRYTHLAKLCMVACVARGINPGAHGFLSITANDYERALEWMVEAEIYMPDLFKSMVLGGDSAAMDEAFRFVWQMYAKDKKPILESRIIDFLRQRVPSHSVLKVFEIMVKSKMIEADGAVRGIICYRPGGR